MGDPAELLVKLLCHLTGGSMAWPLAAGTAFRVDIKAIGCPGCRKGQISYLLDSTGEGWRSEGCVLVRPTRQATPHSDLPAMIKTALLDVGVSRQDRCAACQHLGGMLRSEAICGSLPRVLALQVVWPVLGDQVDHRAKFEIPQKLNIDGHQAQLCGIICREGALLTGGHYVALVGLPDGSWWELNDNSAQQIEDPGQKAFNDTRFPTLILYQDPADHGRLNLGLPLKRKVPDGLTDLKSEVKGAKVVGPDSALGVPAVTRTRGGVRNKKEIDEVMARYETIKWPTVGTMFEDRIMLGVDAEGAIAPALLSDKFFDRLSAKSTPPEYPSAKGRQEQELVFAAGPLPVSVCGIFKDRKEWWTNFLIDTACMTGELRWRGSQQWCRYAEDMMRLTAVGKLDLPTKKLAGRSIMPRWPNLGRDSRWRERTTVGVANVSGGHFVTIAIFGSQKLMVIYDGAGGSHDTSAVKKVSVRRNY